MKTGLSNYFDLSCTNSAFKLRVNWSETYDEETNSSIVTIDSIQIRATNYDDVSYYPDGIIKINGETVITMNSVLGTHNCNVKLNTWRNINLHGSSAATGSAVVVHDDDGTKSICIEVVGNRLDELAFFTTDGEDGSGWRCSGSQTVTLTPIDTYFLAVNEAPGAYVVVERTYSGYAAVGNINSGVRLYYGDKLKVSFIPDSNHRILTAKVNNADFISGNTYTVNGNVDISFSVQALSSSVGATDANIESVSTVTVVKHNDEYWHSLRYSFVDRSGYITQSGGTQDDECRIKSTVISFGIPYEFYEQIPNSKSEVCTITCRTYADEFSDEALGEESCCSLVITASQDRCLPQITATVADINEKTKILTGSENILIKNASTAKCTVHASCKNYSTIDSISIDGVGADIEDGVSESYAEKTFNNVNKTSFVVVVTDSRGYSNSVLIEPIMVSYFEPTCNPAISRPTPTGSKIVLDISGNIYRGSFGMHSNTMVLKYKYKKKGSGYTYGDWIPIDISKIEIGTSSYHSVESNPIELTSYEDEIDTETGESIYPGFDYRSDYEFLVQVSDGAIINDVYNELGYAKKEVSIGKGVPIFDWGEDDFAFHVPVKLHESETTESGEEIESVSEAVSKNYLERVLEERIKELEQKLEEETDPLKDKPIGYIYTAWNHTSPAELFGGVWERIVNPETGEGVFLLSATEGEKIGDFDGESEVTLTINQLPSHSHGFLDYWSTDTTNTSAHNKSVALNGDGKGSSSVSNNRSYTANTGDGAAHNNMPPYVKVSIWRRVE